MRMSLRDFIAGLDLYVTELDTLPTSPGGYVLFDQYGNFWYAGKAGNLKDVVSRHFADTEANPEPVS